jgi:hypothetical protein
LLALAATAVPSSSFAADAGVTLLTDFDGPIVLDVHEDFAAQGARILLELRAAQFSPCGELMVSVERSGARLTLTVEGIARSPGSSRCWAKEPQPPDATIDLTKQRGSRELVVRRGDQSDAYSLEITEQNIAIEPVRPLKVTAIGREGGLGRFLRVPPHTVWVMIDVHPKLAAKAEELLRALEAASARPFAPPSGRYATYQAAWVELGKPTVERAQGRSSRFRTQYHFFHFEGDFDTLVALVKPWKRFDRSHRAVPPPSMSVFIGSSGGGRYNTRS